MVVVAVVSIVKIGAPCKKQVITVVGFWVVFYIVFSCRCAINVPSNFQGPKEAHQTVQRVHCSSSSIALSRRKDLQGSELLTRKENSCWDFTPTSLSSVVLPHKIHHLLVEFLIWDQSLLCINAQVFNKGGVATHIRLLEQSYELASYGHVVNLDEVHISSRPVSR
jgi:hypothetical protein